jgi:hypothetical protein
MSLYVLGVLKCYEFASLVIAKRMPNCWPSDNEVEKLKETGISSLIIILLLI